MPKQNLTVILNIFEYKRNNEGLVFSCNNGYKKFLAITLYL